MPPKAEAKARALPEKRVKTVNSDASANAGMQDWNGVMTDGSKRRYAVETSCKWDDDDFSLVGTEETIYGLSKVIPRRPVMVSETFKRV